MAPRAGVNMPAGVLRKTPLLCDAARDCMNQLWRP
jgi:hypothetical protein